MASIHSVAVLVLGSHRNRWLTALLVMALTMASGCAWGPVVADSTQTPLRRDPVRAPVQQPLVAPLEGEQIATATPFVGVEQVRIVATSPRPLVINALVIDPRVEGVSFLVSPGNGDPNGDEPGDPNLETSRQTVMDFVVEHGLSGAVNGSFFRFLRGSMDTDNVGLVVSRGELVGPFEGLGRPAFHLDAQGVPSVVYQGAGEAPAQLHNAVAGAGHIVRNGLNASPTEGAFFVDLHPRTAAGFTDGGRVILMTVDGRQRGFSEGVSTIELADYLLRFGAVEAVNLDGGGSTTMVIADPKPRLVSSPSDKFADERPGRMRRNGANLGFVAMPNPGAEPMPAYRNPEAGALE